MYYNDPQCNAPLSENDPTKPIKILKIPPAPTGNKRPAPITRFLHADFFTVLHEGLPSSFFHNNFSSYLHLLM